MSENKRTQYEIYRPRYSEHSAKAFEDKIKEVYESVYDLDMLISRLAYELNRSQRLLTPRLSVPFLKNRRVINYGRDVEPVWCWQNFNNLDKKWFVRRIDKPDEFDPKSYFKMKRTSEIIGGNRRAVSRLLKEIDYLLKIRKEVMASIVKLKIQMGLIERKIQSEIRKKEPVVEMLKGRIETRNFVDTDYFSRKMTDLGQ